MKKLLEQYYQLVLKDKKYMEQYITKNTEDTVMDQMKHVLEGVYVWRKINSYDELKKIAHSKEATELLRLNEYYHEQIYDLLTKYLNIDFEELDDDETERIFSDNNLQRITKGVDVPQQVKDCIMIYIESQKVCEELYKYYKENDGILEEIEL